MGHLCALTTMLRFRKPEHLILSPLLLLTRHLKPHSAFLMRTASATGDFAALSSMVKMPSIDIDAERAVVDVVTFDYQSVMHGIAEHYVFTTLIAFFTILTLFLEDIKTIFFPKDIDFVYTGLSAFGLVLFIFEFIVNCRFQSSVYHCCDRIVSVHLSL